MKSVNLILLFFTIVSCVYSQQPGATHQPVTDTVNTVTFITKFNKENRTKDGYYLGDYVVDINPDMESKLDGKKIKVTGKYYIENGLKSEPVQYDKDGKVIVLQGRWEETKHISSPIIEIVD